MRTPGKRRAMRRKRGVHAIAIHRRPQLIPLHIQKNIWATRAGLTYVPTVGEDLQLVNVKPAP